MTCKGGRRSHLPIFLDFKRRSCHRYSMLVTKLRKRAAYPRKIRVTCTKIHPRRNRGEVNSCGCCPIAASRVSRKTRGKTKVPGDTVLYLSQKDRKNAATRNASNDSAWLCVEGVRCPCSRVSSARDTKWKVSPSQRAGTVIRANDSA